MDGPYVDERVSNDALPNQKSNTGPAPINVSARPEAPAPSANDSAFQPSPARILGDMVSDFLPGEPLNPGAEDTFGAQLGGSDVLVAGADSAPAPGPISPRIKGLP